MTRGNYELQQEYLNQRQQEISADLFELGVVSRLAAGNKTIGAVVPIEGIDQLDKLFVPGFRKIRNGDRSERTLSLVAIARGDNSQSYGYLDIGELTEENILFHLPRIEAQDAAAVHEAAIGLLTDQREGVLPNLRNDLLGIENPYTALRLL